MCLNKENYNTEREKGQHLTYDDRVIIAHLYNRQNKNFTDIAKEIGNCHRTTISREIKKGLVILKDSMWGNKEVYVPERAQETYDMNATAKGPKLKIGNKFELAEYIEEKIRGGFSPAAVVVEIAKNDNFNMSLHWKTIYNYIDKGVLEIKNEDMVCGKYKKKKNRPKESERTKVHKKNRTIHDRPEEAEKRERVGHWEMDLVEGKKGKKEPYLLVLSERATRKELIELIPDKTQESVIKGLDRIERRHGVVNFRKTFKTITTDNGTEFKDYKGIEGSFTGSNIPRTKQYYCDAYCSWQRGTNENINKMIRRFLPKGTSFKGVTNRQVKKIQKFINTYPRKILEFKTAREVYREKTRDRVA